MTETDKADSRRRKVLELALSQVWHNEKQYLRPMYALLFKQGWGVRAYRARLELALKYVNRTLDALDALERSE